MKKPITAGSRGRRSRAAALRRFLGPVLIVVVLGCLASFVAIEVRPSIGAGIAGRMRDVFGPQVVAGLESIVFQAQDAVKRWQYGSGIEEAEAPWELAASPAASSQTPAPTGTAAQAAPLPTPTGTLRTPLEAAPPARTSTPTPRLWAPADLAPFGSLEGEGAWQPYLFDSDGQVVGMRTFLQPDPERPYAIVAVVAFDLARTNLHFVLGFNDPGFPDGPKGDGLVPGVDRQPGVLLAAFNGGFRTANGGFGAMADGLEALPPIDGLATVGIYADGTVRIGAWGEEIVGSPDLVAWRQNCPPVIVDGAISDRVYNDSIVDWGGTISNQIVARRSALGLDAGGDTLFYFAGPGLNMPALAQAMLRTGVQDGMLLDINHFWVHFTAIGVAETGDLVAQPLLPEEMIDQVDRYLRASPVDFFYVTLE